MQVHDAAHAVSILDVINSVAIIDPSAAIAVDLPPQVGLSSVVDGPAALSEASELQLTFVTAPKSRERAVASVESRILLAPAGTFGGEGKCLIESARPRLLFAKVCNLLFPPTQELPPVQFRHSERGATTIGEGSVVSPYAFIASGVSIGKRSIISAGASIYPWVTIGDDSFVGPNAVLGGTGFGYERDGHEVILFPHYGSVRIGNRVRVGANTCIDRGSLGDTVIEDDVKIDNSVQVAHNVTVRRGAFLLSGARVSGSADVGERSWIAPNATIGQSVLVGDDSLLGFGSVANKTVLAGSTVFGNPGRHLRVRTAP